MCFKVVFECFNWKNIVRKIVFNFLKFLVDVLVYMDMLEIRWENIVLFCEYKWMFIVYKLKMN